MGNCKSNINGNKNDKEEEMIIAVDTETYIEDKKTGEYKPILDATKFTMGVIIKETAKKRPQIYWNKKELWNSILEIAEAEKRRNKTTTIYAHNHQYDFYAYADLKEIETGKLKIINTSPFIATRQDEKGEPYIYFLDTMAIYEKMSLKKVGEYIKQHKLELPENTYDEKKLEIYCTQDTRICLEAILKLRRKLKEEGIIIQRIFTIGQVAINYTLKKLKNIKGIEKTGLFQDHRKDKLSETYRKEEIEKAYRGGRIEAFKIGEFENVSEIDCNSLYPYAAMNIRFPDLKSERRIWRPLEIVKKEELLNRIGIAKAIVKNTKDEIGLLPIRAGTEEKNENYYPKEGKILVGTWTLMELKKAEEEGYRIENIEWAVTYKETKNPFKIITPEIYKKKETAKTEIDRWLNKQIMNRSYGKLAQKNKTKEVEIINVEDANKYLNETWEIVAEQGKYNRVIERTKETTPKKHYAPIIPCLINAWARIYMYETIKKIGKEKVIYIGTDGIYYTGEIPKEIEISKEIGQWKKEAENQTMIIFGKNSYSIGKQIRISGINTKKMTIEEFKEGLVKITRMETAKTTRKKEDWGKFKEQQRDLKKQLETNIKVQEIYNKMKVYIDAKDKNIAYFTKDLKRVSAY